MGRITTGVPVKTTFGYLFDPKRQAEKDGTVKEKWQVTLLYDNNDPAQKADLDRLMQDAYQEGLNEFGEHFWAMVQQKTIRWPFRDGGEINPNTGQPRFGQGITFINCSSHTRPDVVSRYFDPTDPDKKPRKVTDPAEYYWGELAKVNLTFKTYKRQDGKGVACYVNGVQLWHEGEKLGNAFDAREEFNAEGETPPAQYGEAPQAPPGGAPQSPPAPGQQQNTPPPPPAGGGGRNLL